MTGCSDLGTIGVVKYLVAGSLVRAFNGFVAEKGEFTRRPARTRTPSAGKLLPVISLDEDGLGRHQCQNYRAFLN